MVGIMQPVYPEDKTRKAIVTNAKSVMQFLAVSYSPFDRRWGAMVGFFDSDYVTFVSGIPGQSTHNIGLEGSAW